MFKLIACVPRRKGMSYQDFLDHYRYNHAPKVTALHTFTRHTRSYVQNYSLKDRRLPFTAPADARFDAVTELWFDSSDDFKAAYDEPDYMTDLRVDELRFVNLDDAIIIVSDEVTIVDGAEDGASIKSFVFRRRPKGMSMPEFQREWQRRFASSLIQSAEFKRGVTRYVQDHTISGGGLPGVSDYDLVDIFWFGSVAAAVTFHARSSLIAESLTPEAVVIVAEMRTVVGTAEDRRAKESSVA